MRAPVETGILGRMMLAFEGDRLPAWVAEMDFPLAEPI